MNALEKSIQLNLTGTDAEKVAILRTLTAAPIPINKLANYLMTRKLLMQGRSGAVGSLAGIPDDGLDALYAAITSKASDAIATDRQEWGATFYNSIIALKTGGLITQADEDYIYSLGGGRPYKDLTVADFESQRTVQQFKIDVADLTNAITGAIEIAQAIDGATIVDVQAAAVVAATGWV